MEYATNFIWGAASASYQIEGGWKEGGKGLSIWDVFSHTPGKVSQGDTGDVACNHYFDFQKDIEIMKELNIEHYRFSISWPRIVPDGDGAVNPEGLAYYDALVNALLANGITPFITLYHWDLPQALQDKGGWLNREIVTAFARYAEIIVTHFADRVSNYMTINEPQCIAFLGYKEGLHAPGLQLDNYQVMKVFHHLAMAHGAAVKSMRSASEKPLQIGFAATGKLCYPSEETPENLDLARKLTFTIDPDKWGFSHHIFADGILKGIYPDLSSILDPAMIDFILPEDMQLMCQPIEFYGVNVYNGSEVSTTVPDYYVPKYAGFPKTALKWPITPEVMNWGLRILYERYQLPIIISENGLSCNDKIYRDQQVHDIERIDFLSSYLSEMELAIDAGTPVIGYFHWALTDNFEWHSGYDERFGLVYIDYRNQNRIIKDSGYWYADYMKCKS